LIVSSLEQFVCCIIHAVTISAHYGQSARLLAVLFSVL